jgi:Predicted nucleoside-diphosphate-sugar epimerases
MTIAITGATGNIGGAVARSLLNSGVDDVRLLVRSPARIPEELKEIPHSVCMYADDEAALAALRGVDTLFMVSAKESPSRVADHRAFIDATLRAQVANIVYTSFLGAAPEAIFTHARDHFFTEEHIKAADISWTILRDSFYLEFFAELIDSGEIRGPAGDGACAGVSRSDVVRAASAILTNPAAHAGATYDLTGPAAFTMEEAATMGAKVTGRPVEYIDETIEQAWASREPYGAPQWEIAAWITTYTAIRAGQLDVVSDDVRRITGKAPLSLSDVLAATETK